MGKRRVWGGEKKLFVSATLNVVNRKDSGL